jgi:P27 family predicted phage terminase small subunit
MKNRIKTPSNLGRDGRQLWREALEQFGVNDAPGLRLLEVACRALDRLHEAQAAIRADGVVILDRYGCKKAHPALRIEKEARDGFLGALRQLNFDIAPPKQPGRPPSEPWLRNGTSSPDHNSPRNSIPRLRPRS